MFRASLLPMTGLVRIILFRLIFFKLGGIFRLMYYNFHCCVIISFNLEEVFWIFLYLRNNYFTLPSLALCLDESIGNVFICG